MGLDPDPPMRPIERIEGQLSLEDHGLIGDGTTAALVGRDGTVSWLCAPRFDGPALFASLLDPDRGGHFALHPVGCTASRQRYVPDTGVLITEMDAPEGTVEVTDALALQRGADVAEGMACDRRELVRLVEVTRGRVRLRVEVSPRGGGRGGKEGGGSAGKRQRPVLRSRDPHCRCVPHKVVIRCCSSLSSIW